MSKLYSVPISLLILLIFQSTHAQDFFSATPVVDALVDDDNNGTESVDVFFQITSQSNTPNARIYFINAFNLSCPSGLSCTYIPCVVTVPGGVTLGYDFSCTGKIIIEETGLNGGGNMGDYTLSFTPSKLTSPSEVDASYSYVAMLPVELTQFQGNYRNGQIKLNWETAAEFNNEKFVVEKSRDGLLFSPIGEVVGSGTTLIARNYTFLDSQPLPGSNFYRLRQVDMNGSFEFSPIIEVAIKHSKPVLVYPTLVKEYLHIEFLEEESASIKVLDLHGRIVKVKAIDLSTSVSLDMSSVPPGNYLVQIKTPYNILTDKIVRM